MMYSAILADTKHLKAMAEFIMWKAMKDESDIDPYIFVKSLDADDEEEEVVQKGNFCSQALKQVDSLANFIEVLD